MQARLPGEDATGVPSAEHSVPVEAILARVAETYGTSPGTLVGRYRGEPVVSARHLAMYLCRTLAGMSLPQIGSVFSRDHTTVLHGIRRIARSMGDENYATFVFEVSDKLKEEHSDGTV